MVLVELGGHRNLQLGDRDVLRLDDPDESDHGVAESGFDAQRLSQGPLVELGDGGRRASIRPL